MAFLLFSDYELASATLEYSHADSVETCSLLSHRGELKCNIASFFFWVFMTLQMPNAMVLRGL